MIFKRELLDKWMDDLTKPLPRPRQINCRCVPLGELGGVSISIEFLSEAAADSWQRFEKSIRYRRFNRALAGCALAIAYAPPVAILLHSILCRLSTL